VTEPTTETKLPLVRETVRILKDGHPMLAMRSQEIADDEFDDDLKALIARMISVMMGCDAVGLAAVQIGIPARVIVVREGGEIIWFINPERVGKPFWRTAAEPEACLSVTGRYVVERPLKIEVRYRDVDGVEHVNRFKGLRARIIQHEMDHLDGILISESGL
jgi:peptide deformylase